MSWIVLHVTPSWPQSFLSSAQPEAKGWTCWTINAGTTCSLALSFSVCQSEVFTLLVPSDTPSVSTMQNTLIQEQHSWFTCSTGELWTPGHGVDRSRWGWGSIRTLKPPCGPILRACVWVTRQRLGLTPIAYMKCICSHYPGLSAAGNTRGLA